MNNLNYKNFRSITPRETIQRISPFLKDMGITRAANITGLDEVGIPVYCAIRPNSRSLSLSQGKGLSPDSAKVSALMETIESYHAEHIEADYKDLSVSELIDKGYAICNYTELPQYLNSSFSDRDKIFWMTGKNLITSGEVIVPYSSVNTDMRISAVCDKVFIKSSNGLASGNTQKEALNHGLCELIERDAYSCWTVLNNFQRQRTKVEIETITCPVSQHLIELIKSADISIGIWNITSDLEIPSFLVRIISKTPPPICTIPPASGFGCHPDKNLALIRALTEAAQSRLTFISGARDDIRLSHYRTFTSKDEYQRWLHSINIEEAYVSYNNITTHDAETADDVKRILLHNLIKQNLNEIILVDLTISRFDIPVLKVLVPGLEGPESYNSMKPGKRALNIINSSKI